MKDQYFIGIDIGSSSVKSAIFDTQGNELGEARRNNPLSQPRAGVAEYNGPQILKSILSAIQDLLVQSNVPPKDVAALCLDGMISGTMGIDAAGEATTPYTTTLDTRFTPHLDHVLEQFHDPIREQTGSGQPTFAPKMLWLRDEFSDLYRKTAKFVTITSYVSGKMAGLSGNEAFVDYTHLWATGLSDTRHYRWSDDLCKAMDLPIEKLPRIVKSSEIIGKLSADMATSTGLLSGTPIVAGAGDQSVGYIAAGLTQPGRMVNVAGTYSNVAFCTNEFRPDLEHRMAEIFPSPIAGLWNPVSYVIGSGLTHRWFEETFAVPDEVAAEKPGPPKSAFDDLDKRASQLPPGSEKLVFIPHLGGRACPNQTNFRGTWLGITWTHRREHFYRALMESIAYDHYLSYQSLQASYPEAQVAEIMVYGGGARNALWNQIKADVMGLPYVSLDRQDLSTLGDAILAGYAVGVYDDLATTAKRFIQQTERFEPRPDVHRFYGQYTEYYRLLLEQVEPAYDNLAGLDNWDNGGAREERS